jgi:hypothetical protein
METKHVLNQVSEVDMKQHNPFQEIYKFSSCRNTLECDQNYDLSFDDSLNNSVKTIRKCLFQFFEFNNISQFTLYINANEINCAIIIKSDLIYLSKSDLIDFIIYKTSIHICHLQFNDNIYITNYYKDIINTKHIYRYILTFHQTDDNISHNLHNKIYDISKSEYLERFIFIGGEMYLYGVLLEEFYKIAEFYTDFQSIYDDCVLNNQYDDKQIDIYKVDYDTMNFKNHTYDNSCVLINIGKIGLGRNICEKLLTHNHKALLIISCHKKSFNRDYNILQTEYKITHTYTFTTIYDVDLYVLNKI